MKLTSIVVLASAVVIAMSGSGCKTSGNASNTNATAGEMGVIVTPETFIHAETDGRFNGIVKRAGGVNLPSYFRVPTPLDAQIVMRMNRDTVYTMYIVDTSKGATITVPELPKDRLVSIFPVDNDHYSPELIPATPGTHEIPAGTKYMAIGVRLQVFNPNDPAELAMLNKLQDQFIVKANSADPMPAFKWDMASLKALETKYERDFVNYTSSAGMMAP